MSALRKMTALLSFLLVLPVTAFSADVPATVSILEVTGTVQIRDKGASDWVPAEKGRPVAPGTEILTETDATCQIGFYADQKSAVNIQGGSKINVESVSPVKVALQNGRLYAFVRDLKPTSSFTIQTPTAVASARGTDGFFSDKLAVGFEGTWNLATTEGEVFLEPGMAVEFSADGHEVLEAIPDDLKEEYEDVRGETVENLETAAVEVVADRAEEKKAETGASEEVSEGAEDSADSEGNFDRTEGSSSTAAEKGDRAEDSFEGLDSGAKDEESIDPFEDDAFSDSTVGDPGRDLGRIIDDSSSEKETATDLRSETKSVDDLGEKLGSDSSRRSTGSS
jgi:hypothetical protein